MAAGCSPLREFLDAAGFKSDNRVSPDAHIIEDPQEYFDMQSLKVELARMAKVAARGGLKPR